MNKSESIKNLAIALVGFQSEIGRIGKTATNPFFRSKYTPLPKILEAIQDPLANNGLSFAQLPDGEGLTTILMHESGEWLESTYQMRPEKNTPQGQGSAITYARRYALSAILGLNTDGDDDGNAASTPPKQAEKQAPTAAPVCTIESVQTTKGKNYIMSMLKNGSDVKGVMKTLKSVYVGGVNVGVEAVVLQYSKSLSNA